MEGENEKQVFQPIDIREIVRNKNPKIEKRIPEFIYNWLKRLLHIEEFNDFLKEAEHLEGIEFINKAISHLNIKYNIDGLENIPKHGRYLFTSNHPLGGLDGILLLKILNDKAGLTRVIINDFLMAVNPLKKLFVPVNKVGGQSRASIQNIEELYQSDDQILIFPAGLCSRKIKGKITDLDWQKHFIQKSKQYKLDIIPIYFQGNNTNRFYNLANLRKFFHIKFNIEMMFLVDEMFKHRNKSFDIYFGKKIPHTTFNQSKRPIEWAAMVKEETYQLQKNK